MTRSRWRRCIGALWLAGAMHVGLAAGVPETPYQRSFTSVPGIPRNVVASAVQDQAGWLWIGTGDGLARFDGYRLQAVERDGDDALARNMGWVRAMWASANGRVWFGTESSGLAFHDPDTGRITVVGGPEPGGSLSIVSLTEDAQGRIWFGTLGGGVRHYDPRTKRFEILTLPGELQGEGQVHALATGPEGTVWVGHWRGLARWAPGGTGLEAVPLPSTAPNPTNPVTALLPLPSGGLWLGTKTGHLGHWAPDASGPSWLPSDGVDRGAVQALRLGPDGLLWVGHRGGLELRDPDTGAIRERLTQRAELPGGLAGNEVTTLLRDPTGAMWVGGFGIGLQRHRDAPAFAVRGPDPSGPLSDTDVRTLLALRDGSVLAATRSGRLAVMDGELRVTREWPRPGALVEALAEAPDGSVWLGLNNRLQQHAPDGRLLRRWLTDAGAALALRVEADGTVLLGAEQGLYRWRPGQAEPQPVTDTRGVTLGREVFALAPDGEGGWWVGGRAGLHRLRAGGQHLAPVEGAPGEALGFPLVIGLLRDGQGSLWLDTPVAGLHRLLGHDAQGRARFDRISIRHGIAGRPYGANLHQDARGRIWSQSFVYDPAADRLDELRPADGVQFGTPWFRSHTRLGDGRLLFGGSQGLLVVRPERYEPSSDQPAVVLSAVRVNGLPHRPDSLRQGLQLPPGTRSFGVEFAALEFADPQLVRYRHRLVGYDPDWVPSDASFRSPSYSQLRPGDYLLEVQATNRSGVWSPHTLRLPVRLQPQWWQRAWAPWALAAAVGLSLGAWITLRTRQMRRRQAELQALVDERTAELRNASLTDPLTGLRNRRYVSQRIDDDLHLAQRQHQQRPGRDDADLLVFLVDLDHFKRINDTHGHAAGDAVLVQAAQRLREVFRDTDTLVRWGGEEFLAIARASNRSHAAELAERLRYRLSETPYALGAGLPSTHVTASIGFVAYPPDPAQPLAWDWAALLQLADAALYAAKDQGRNGWVGVAAADAAVPGVGSPADWLTDPRVLVQRSA